MIFHLRERDEIFHRDFMDHDSNALVHPSAIRMLLSQLNPCSLASTYKESEWVSPWERMDVCSPIHTQPMANEQLISNCVLGLAKAEAWTPPLRKYVKWIDGVFFLTVDSRWYLIFRQITFIFHRCYSLQSMNYVNNKNLNEAKQPINRSLRLGCIHFKVDRTLRNIFNSTYA